MNKKIKSKYKLGQKLYFIGRYGMDCQIVQAIFNRGEDIQYSFAEASWKYNPDEKEGYLKSKSEDLQFESDVYPTREALLKALKEQELEND